MRRALVESQDTGRDAEKKHRPVNWARTLRMALFSVVFSIGAVYFLGSDQASFGVLDVRIAFTPTMSMRGVTDIVFTPLGGVSARTHKFPSKITLSVERIQADAAIALTESRSARRQALRETKQEGASFFRRFLKHLILISVIGGIFGALIGAGLGLPRLGGPRALALGAALPGALIGFVTVTVPLAFTLFTYNPAGFRNPQYDGLISKAPKLLPYIYSGISKSEILGEQISKISTNLSDFYFKLDALGGDWTLKGDRITILHVSDLHNNPLALQVLRPIMNSARPDIIIDTGDITDHGAPEELDLVAGLKDLPAPHVFISGNHDSVEVVERMKSEFGAIVLDDSSVEIKGLRILGFGDPKARLDFPKDAQEDTAGLAALEKIVRRKIQRSRPKPQVLLIHDPTVSEKFAGAVPLILSGHTHNANIQNIKSTVIVNAGTTGASGVRYFKNFEKPFYSAAVITLVKGKTTVKIEQVTMLYLDQIENDFGVYVKRFD